MPGYWFMYNMYALSRNTWKYKDRDRRTEKIQMIEYDFLAPDSINEMFASIKLLSNIKPDDKGEYFTKGLENSDRKIQIIKLPQALELFKELITFYGTTQLFNYIKKNNFTSFDKIKKSLSTKIQRTQWLNIGGQLITTTDTDQLKRDLKSGKIQSWQQLHEEYKRLGENYDGDKLSHAYTCLLEILNITAKQFTIETFSSLLGQSIKTQEWMCKGIYDSREKDYTNPFRKMVYDTKSEMEMVTGKLEDNTFIQQQLGSLDEYKKDVKHLIQNMAP